MNTPRLLRPGARYASSISVKTHAGVALISFISYVSIIIFGFVPVTQRIESGSGGNLPSDLQQGGDRERIDGILTSLQPVMEDVRLLSLLDYVFIIAGFILFWSLHSIVFSWLKHDEKLVNLPLVGMLLTIISRSLDSLENLWVILMYSNPQNYATFLIPLTNFTETAKWTVVNVEYVTLGVALIVGLIKRREAPGE